MPSCFLIAFILYFHLMSLNYGIIISGPDALLIEEHSRERNYD